MDTAKKINRTVNPQIGEGRSVRRFIGYNVPQGEYAALYEQMRNTSGTVRGMVQRLTTRAEMGAHHLHKEKGLDGAEICLLSMCLGAQIGGGEFYAHMCPYELQGDLERLVDGLGVDDMEALGWINEYAGAVGPGSILTQWMAREYGQRWGFEPRWDMGDMTGPGVAAMRSAGAEWWVGG